MLVLLLVGIIFEMSTFVLLLPLGIVTAITGATGAGAVGIAAAGALLACGEVWDSRT
jgi:hypothetical protein